MNFNPSNIQNSINIYNSTYQSLKWIKFPNHKRIIKKFEELFERESGKDKVSFRIATAVILLITNNNIHDINACLRDEERFAFVSKFTEWEGY